MSFRRLFTKYRNNDYSDVVLEHIHIVEQGHKFVSKNLLFRDYLRHSEKDRTAYCEMKKEIVKRGV